MANAKAPHSPALKRPGKKNKKPKKAPRHAAATYNHSFFKTLLCIFAVFAVMFVFVVIYANNYDKIYPNTYIYDTNVSNMSSEDLKLFLKDSFNNDKISGQSILFTCNENDYSLSIDSLDIRYDIDSTAAEIISSGKSGNPFSNTLAFLLRFFKQKTIESSVTYNHDVLSDAVNNVTAAYESEPVGHTFIIGENNVTVIGPVNGIKADRQAAFGEAEHQIKTMCFSSIDLSLKSVKPDALDFDVFYSWLTSAAENSYYEKNDGKITVHPSKPKVDIDRDTVKNALEELKNAESNTVDIAATVTQPETTSQYLSDILYSNLLGTYSTNFGGSSAARAVNVRLAASRINGTELMPGEEFSYDKTILPRNAQNGYMAAPVYVGNKVESGMGGGICQPSSTLYVAALYANMEITERHNHSLKVGYIPPGLDATIAEGSLDLKFKNSSAYPVKICSSAENGVLTFSFYGYNPENITVKLLQSSKNDIYYVTRAVYKGGTEIKREAMTSSKYNIPEKDEDEEEN